MDTSSDKTQKWCVQLLFLMICDFQSHELMLRIMIWKFTLSWIELPGYSCRRQFMSVRTIHGDSQFMPVRAIHCNSRCELLACFFDSNSDRNSHTNHGVVACSDETHHFYIKVPAALFGVMKKPVFSTKNRMCSMSELHHVDVFLDTL